MTITRLQRPSMITASSQNGFVPESLKEMKRAASCRKFNLGSLSTPQAVKKMFSMSKAAPDLPTGCFVSSAHKNQEMKRRASSAPRGGGRPSSLGDQDKPLSRQSQSGRRSMLRRQTSLAATESQAPTPRGRRSSSVGAMDGVMGMSLSLSNQQYQQQRPTSTNRRPVRRSLSAADDVPRMQSARRYTHQSFDLRKSPCDINEDVTPTRRSSQSRPFAPSSHGGRRRRRFSLDDLERRAPLVADLDDGMSDNESMDGISIDETVSDLMTKGRKNSKSPKRNVESLGKHSNHGSRAARRTSSLKSEDKHMSRSSRADRYSSTSTRFKSKSSDHSAFCTPRRSIVNKMEMPRGDVPAWDDLSIDDTIVDNTDQQQRPKMEKPKKCRRSTSDESRLEYSSSRKPERKFSRSKSFVKSAPKKMPPKSKSSGPSSSEAFKLAVKSAKEEVAKSKTSLGAEQAMEGKTSKKKLPRRSKTLDAPTAAALKPRVSTKQRMGTPRMPSRSKSFSLQNAKEETKTRNTAETPVGETCDGPPAVIEVITTDIKAKMESLPSGYDDEAVPVPPGETNQRAPTQTWSCTCGHKSDSFMKCCGMCGTKQHWTCSSCQSSDNMCIFAFCCMCGDEKRKEGEQRTPPSPSSVVTPSA